MQEKSRKLLGLAVFAAAMGFLEAIVVVYLRALYYPEGFYFPLAAMPGGIYLTEVLREICTLVMLAAIGWMGSSTPFTRFTCFLYLFGVWDLFYYLALKLLLDWPASLFTWDVLFLIPITWIGPVIAPVLCALAMIVLHLAAERFLARGERSVFNGREWLLLLAGALFVYVSFTIDYTLLIFRHDLTGGLTEVLRDEKMVRTITQFIPSRFAWEIYIPGLLLILAALFSFIRAAPSRVTAAIPPAQN